jgi:hypothetical protein
MKSLCSFLFIWFWFVILAIITGLQLVARFATLGSPMVRQMMLRKQARLNTSREVDTVMRKCQFGDWFLLVSLARNLNSFIFGEYLSDLASVMDVDKSNNVELTPLNPSAPETVEYPTAALSDKEKYY